LDDIQTFAFGPAFAGLSLEWEKISLQHRIFQRVLY